jgi:hypothetical protein
MVREPRLEDQIFLGKKDEHGRDVHRQLQDKLAKS